MKNNDSKIIIFFFSGIFIGLAIGFFIFYPLNPFYKNSGFYKMKKILFAIENQYYKDIDLDEKIDYLIKILTKDLDPFSSYINDENYKSYEVSITYKFNGIGIRYDDHWGNIVIEEVFDNSPAEKAGLKPGDIILKVNDTVTYSAYQAVKIIRHVLPNPIKLQIKRCDSIFTVIIPTREIKINTVYGFLLDSSTGYIAINSISLNTGEEFKKALLQLKKQNIKNLILDLRDNPGGIIKESVKIIDPFFPENTQLFKLIDKNGKTNTFYSTQDTMAKNLKLAVIINAKTASAAELIAGVIQDYDRGIILGQKSYGKAVVQTDMRISNKEILHITTKKIILPSGRWYQKKVSDMVYHFDVDSVKAFLTKNKRRVLSNSGIIPDTTTIKYEFDYYLYLTLDSLAELFLHKYEKELCKSRSDAAKISKMIETFYKNELSEADTISKYAFMKILFEYALFVNKSTYYKVMIEEDPSIAIAKAILNSGDYYNLLKNEEDD